MSNEAIPEAVLDALGDATRRRIVEQLRRGPVAVGELAARLPVARPDVGHRAGGARRSGRGTDRPHTEGAHTEGTHQWLSSRQSAARWSYRQALRSPSTSSPKKSRCGGRWRTIASTAREAMSPSAMDAWSSGQPTVTARRCGAPFWTGSPRTASG